VLLATTGSLALYACGGASGATFGAPAGDGGVSEDGGTVEDAGGGDGSVPLPHPGQDGGKGDAGGGFDAGGGGVSCIKPLIPDGGEFLGCLRAVCPAGTVCAQRDSDITSIATCVAIPPACVGNATCACMGNAAQECAEPGVPLTDAGGLFGCQDDDEEDASFLDFPCGCA
jgi:hypothetical protein